MSPGLDPAEIDDVILGCAMPEAEQGLNVARIASLRAGIPVSASAMTINRFCSSGLQAIALAAERVMVGAADVIVAGGTESMSLVPMGGHKVAPNPALVERHPDVYLTTGLVAENHARESGISREMQDAFALRSHQRAIAAIDAGRFDEELLGFGVRPQVPAPGPDLGSDPRSHALIADEGPRRDTSLDALAKLRPAFHVNGTVTAGNSSQTSDGASAVVVMNADRARTLGLSPLGRFVGFATAACRARTIWNRSGSGDSKDSADDRADARPDRSRRAQRSVRLAGARVPEGTADRSGSIERQRRRDCARSPARLHGGQIDDDDPLRDEASPGAIWARQHVRGRRHGRRRRVRKRLRIQGDPMTVASTTRGGTWLIEPAEQILTRERLSDEQRMIGQTAESFVDHEVVPHLDDLERKDWSLARSLIRRSAELGLVATDVPEAYGGLELDKVSSVIVGEAVGRCASFATTFGAQTGLTITPLLCFGTDQQKQTYLPRLVTGEIIGAYSLSESGSGSDALGARTRATRQADGSFVLSGEKMWITSGGFADIFIVFAKVDGTDFTAFIVERSFPGVSTGNEEHKLGLLGSSTTSLILQDARVPGGQPPRRNRQGAQDCLQHAELRTAEARCDVQRWCTFRHRRSRPLRQSAASIR